MIRILQQDNRITKAVFAVIIGAAIIAMVVTLVPGIFDIGSSGDSNVYATVRTPGLLGRFSGDSKTIRMDAVNRVVAQQMEQQHLPPMYSMLFVPRVEQQMVAQAVLAREADKLGLSASDDDVRRELQTGTLGQYIFPSGKFIGDDQYVNFVQAAFNMSVADFEGEVKSDIELQRLEALETGGLTVSDEAVRNEYKQQGTKIKFDYAVISASDLKKNINPSDSDLQAFFTQNGPRYATAVPETRKIEFFSFDASSLKDHPAITDVDIQSYYNQHQTQYKVDEQVQTRHILIPVTRGADAKAEADAKAKAQEALNQVKAGGNFAELAKKYSEDPGSKEKGGELPMIPTAQLDPAYAKAAMALSPGQTSDLVRSQFGYHIIQTEKKDAAHIKPLAEVRDEIVPLLTQQKSGAALQNFAAQLAAEAKSNGMQKTADAHGMHLTATDYVGRDGSIPALADSTALLTQAFAVAKGAAPATASTGEGFAVFQVDDIHAAHAPAFADYKITILNDYRDQKAPELLSTQLTRLADQAKITNDLKKAAAGMNIPVKTSDLVGKDGQVPDVGSMSGQAAVAFTLPKGGLSGPINTGPNGIVLQVQDKQEPTADEIAKNFTATREKLLSTERQEYFNAYAENLVARYEKAGAVVLGQKAPAAPSPFGPARK